MRHARTARLALASALGLLLAAPAALADPPAHAQGHGKHKPGNGPQHVPPGWAKQAWRKGDRLPVAELDGYWVSDYDHYHLHAPPPGHRWVRQDDGRYLLVAIATGVIIDILLR